MAELFFFPPSRAEVKVLIQALNSREALNANLFYSTCLSRDIAVIGNITEQLVVSSKGKQLTAKLQIRINACLEQVFINTPLR
jgi:hypothetical protein